MKVSFPRIYVLAVDKKGVVGDFGSWCGSEWTWKVPLRRRVFDWEQEQWLCFNYVIHSKVLCQRIRDELVWIFDPKGLFSVGSFRKEWDGEDVTEEGLNKFCWQGLVPPKVELFGWQLIKEKVMVKKKLSNYGMFPGMSVACVLCSVEEESVNHLFLHCSWAWKLWVTGMGWWRVIGCIPKTIAEWADSWVALSPSRSSRRAWTTLFFAIVWTIWDFRNNKIFKDKEASLFLASDTVLFRVAWWFKHHGKGSSDPITTLLRNISEFCKDSNMPKKSRFVRWIPPGKEALKFNVDGSSRGNPGAAGIGGVLQNNVWVGFVPFLISHWFSGCHLCRTDGD